MEKKAGYQRLKVVDNSTDGDGVGGGWVICRETEVTKNTKTLIYVESFDALFIIFVWHFSFALS